MSKGNDIDFLFSMFDVLLTSSNLAIIFIRGKSHIHTSNPLGNGWGWSVCKKLTDVLPDSA